jgi:predicted ABC-type ATPase
MPKIYLIEGPVGAGKSTFGLSLSQQFHVPCLILVEVPPAFFDMASDAWEPLSEDECNSREVIFL